MELNLDRIRKANETFAAEPPPPREGRPSSRLTILTCMDTRIDPYAAFGLQAGEAHILRNGGGRVTDDALRSIALSAHVLGTREVGVIHHTRCGLHGGANADIAAKVAEGGGDASDIDFLPFDDLDKSVADDIATLRGSGVLPPDAVVWGAVYDVDSGVLRITDEP